MGRRYTVEFPLFQEQRTMGKGDRKTAKGKRYNASYGNARSHASTTKSAGVAKAPVVKKTATKATKTVAKKTVAKKTAAK